MSEWTDEQLRAAAFAVMLDYSQDRANLHVGHRLLTLEAEVALMRVALEAAKSLIESADEALEIDVRAFNAIKRVPHRHDVAGDTYVSWQEFTNAVYDGDSLRDVLEMRLLAWQKALVALRAGGHS